MEADEGEHADGGHVGDADQNGTCGGEPGDAERNGRGGHAPAVFWSAPHGHRESEETQREDDESGEEQRIEHGLDAVPQQHERCLILGRCSGGLVEVRERGGRDVGHGPGGEQDQTKDAQGRPEQCWGRASPAQTGSSLYRVGLVGLAPAWRVDGGKIVSLTA